MDTPLIPEVASTRRNMDTPLIPENVSTRRNMSSPIIPENASRRDMESWTPPEIVSSSPHIGLFTIMTLLIRYEKTLFVMAIFF